MINQQLIDYIKQESQKGTSEESIKNGLIANGWTNQDIEEAYRNLSNISPPLVSSIPRLNKKLIWIPALTLLIVASGALAFTKYNKKSEEILPVIDTSTPSVNIDTATNTTQSWKVYTSDFAGISFEYPDNENFKINPHIYAINNFDVQIVDSKSSTDYSIRAILNTKYKNNEELITKPDEDTRLSMNLFDHDLSHYSKTNISGYSAYKQTIPPSDKFVDIFLTTGDNSYVIQARTLPTLPVNLKDISKKDTQGLLDALKKAEDSQPNLTPNDSIWAHLLSSIKFFPPVITQEKQDLQSASQDNDLIYALFDVSANLDKYCCAAGGTYPQYIPIRNVYPSSLDELYTDKSVYGYESYIKYKKFIKYSVSLNKKRFHIGILLSAPQLTETKKRLGEDSDFDSKTLGWINGFNGVDPIFDMIDTRELK